MWLPFVIASFLLAACGGQAPPETGAPPVSTPQGSVAPQASTTPAAAEPSAAPQVTFPAALSVADDEMRDALLAAGLGAADAEFLAMTGIVAESLDPLHHRVLQTFANGDTLELEFSVEPIDGAPLGAVFTSATTADGVVFSYRYDVDGTGAPQELTDAQAAQALTRLLSVLGSGSAPPLVAEGGKSTFRILVEGVAKQGGKELVTKLAKTIDAKFPKLPVGVNNLWKAIKQGGYVMDAYLANQVASEAIQTLLALRQCVVSPTDQRTIRQYADFPGDRSRMLEQVDDAISDVKAMGAVMTIGPGTKSAAGHFGITALSFVISPGFSAANDRLSRLISERVAEVAAGVVPCSGKAGWAFEVATGGVRMSGRKCGSIGGTWIATSVTKEGGSDITVTYTFDVDEVAMRGTWKIDLRGGSPGMTIRAAAAGDIRKVKVSPDGTVWFDIESPQTIKHLITTPDQSFVVDVPWTGQLPFNWPPDPSACD